MRDGVVLQGKELSDRPQDPQHVHISGRIVGEDVGRIEISRPQLEDPVRPGGETGCVVSEALGQGGGEKPQDKGNVEKSNHVKPAQPAPPALSLQTA